MYNIALDDLVTCFQLHIAPEYNIIQYSSVLKFFIHFIYLNLLFIYWYVACCLS